MRRMRTEVPESQEGLKLLYVSPRLCLSEEVPESQEGLKLWNSSNPRVGSSRLSHPRISRRVETSFLPFMWMIILYQKSQEGLKLNMCTDPVAKVRSATRISRRVETRACPSPWQLCCAA